MAVAEQEPITEQKPADVEIPAESIADVQSGDGGNGADVQSGIDEGLASLARDYGFDPDEWKANPAALERAVTQFDRLYSHHNRLAAQKPAEQSTDKPAPTKTDWKRYELALKALEGDDLDPSIVGFSKQAVEVLRQMNDHYAGQIEAYEKRFGELSPLQEKVAAMEQYVQQQEQQRTEQMLDDAFDKLGAEFTDLYGKGPMHGLKPTSLHAHNRMEVFQSLADVQSMDARAGRRTPFANQFARAQRLAHGDQLPTIERRRLALKAHQQRNSALSRPATKNGSPLNEEDNVLAKLKEWTSRTGV